MNWEYCHPAKTNGADAGIDYVHEQTRMALEYMKGFEAPRRSRRWRPPAKVSTAARPNRADVERLVRQAVYARSGRVSASPRLARPNPLVVNVSARHCHVTQDALERLFGKATAARPSAALSDRPFRGGRDRHDHRPPQPDDLQPAHSRPMPDLHAGRARLF